MRFLITDYDFPDVELELALCREAGMEIAAAQCRTEEDVIALPPAARGCSRSTRRSARGSSSGVPRCAS